MPRALLSLSLALLLCSLATPAATRAQTEPAELNYKLKLDVPVTALALSLWLGTELAKPALAPSRCHWCDDNRFDRGVRDSAMWENTGAARSASNWITAGVLPLGLVAALGLAAGRDRDLEGLGVDAMIITQAVALSGLLTQTAKFLVARERPFVHALSSDEKARTAHPADNNLSFYSAHTSFAFSLAVAAGTTASMRGYRGAAYVWAVGLPLALLSGYLRIAADRHYTSDVLVGAALGSLFGGLVPWLLHRPTL